MDLSGFNPEEVDTGSGDSFEPLPAGWYPVVIIDSEEKETRAGNGSYLQLTLEVIDGEFKGRLLWARLNLNNPNPKAVEIAQRDLANICKAVGVMAPKDSSDLHYKPLAARVKIRPYEGEMRNEVSGFRGIRGAGQAQQPRQQQRPAAQQQRRGPSPGKASAPPWARGKSAPAQSQADDFSDDAPY